VPGSCFEDTYTEFAHTSDVCAGADRELEDHEDDRTSTEGSSGDDSALLDSDDEGGVGIDDDEAENVKKFVQESILRLVEMKQKMGCSINHFEELLKWGKNLHTSGNIDAAIHWPESGMRCNHCLRNWAFLSLNIFGFVLAKTILVIMGSWKQKVNFVPIAVVQGQSPITT